MPKLTNILKDTPSLWTSAEATLYQASGTMSLRTMNSRNLSSRNLRLKGLRSRYLRSHTIIKTCVRSGSKANTPISVVVRS